MLSSARELWVLAAAFFSCGASMAFIDVHLVPSLHDHGVAPVASSATFVSLGVLEIVGALIAGRLCDAGYVKRVLVGAYIVRAFAMIVVAFPLTAGSAIVFGGIFGASYLATVVATTMWLIQTLPVAARGTGIGLVWAVHSLGAAASSQLGAYSNDLWRSYRPAIILIAGLVVGAALITALLPYRHADREVAVAGADSAA